MANPWIGLLIMSKAVVMAASFIRVQLQGGPKSWQEIEEAGARFGHRPRTLRRARSGVARPRHWVDDNGRLHWHWELKEETQ